MNRSTVRRTKVQRDNWNKDDDDSHDVQQNYGFEIISSKVTDSERATMTSW